MGLVADCTKADDAKMILDETIAKYGHVDGMINAGVHNANDYVHAVTVLDVVVRPRCCAVSALKALILRSVGFEIQLCVECWF